jgi:signal transduction histidine kinase/CheY-like chemotaxis protein
MGPRSPGGSAEAFGPTAYSLLQQQLISANERLDRQVAQLTRLNRLSNEFLHDPGERPVAEKFAEAIVDVLDLAIGAVWLLTTDAQRTGPSFAAVGLPEGSDAWANAGRPLAEALASHEGSRRLEGDLLALLPGQDLVDQVACRCLGRDGSCVAVIVAANTRAGAGMSDPVRDEAPEVLAVIAEKLAAHLADAAHEEESRRVEARLRETAKFEALVVLAGGIAHDFNNLLVAILGHVEFARSDLPAGSPAVADLEAAETAAHRAADLARQMLAYSGRGSLATGPVMLDTLLREMGDLVSHSISKGASLRYEFAPGLPPVLADVTQVRQLALNLVVNASDALEGQRGTITLRTGLLTLAADDPTLVPGTVAEAGEYVALEVSDTGRGMDAATLARIFDPFFSTKSAGRGLGLAAALGIVKGHGGAIRVVSSPGVGTTFQVFLRPTQHDRAAAGPVVVAPYVHNGGCVLLVDDEPTVRTVARRVLERAGIEVAEATDGSEAIDRFRAAPDSFEGVILDLTLPTIDGMTVLRELRATRPDVPVVLCSGWSADEVVGGLEAMPRTVFLQKPFTAQAMIDALVQVRRTPDGR